MTGRNHRQPKAVYKSLQIFPGEAAVIGKEQPNRGIVDHNQ